MQPFTVANPRNDFPPIRACLFDMDGLLIDSEDIYTICTNIILHEYGKPSLPWSVKAQLQGRPGPEAGRIFHEWAQLPISHADFMIKQSVLQREKWSLTRPLPGVHKLLQILSSASPSVHLALATSSHKINFKLKSAHLNELFSNFAEERRVLGDDSRIAPGKGKPAPDIYLLALKTINDSIMREGSEKPIALNECLVFEDSVLGVEAGRRAGMRVIWCPHPELLNEVKGREKEVLAGITSEPQDDFGKHGLEAAPGMIDDGWAELIKTMEDFNYKKYGINVKENLVKI